MKNLQYEIRITQKIYDRATITANVYFVLNLLEQMLHKSKYSEFLTFTKLQKKMVKW